MSYPQIFHRNFTLVLGAIPRLAYISALPVGFVRFFAPFFHSILHNISTALSHCEYTKMTPGPDLHRWLPLS